MASSLMLLPSLRKDDREDLLLFSKISEITERYDEMAEAMKLLVEVVPGELTVEERNLLSVAFKNVIGCRRSSWRVFNALEQKEESKGKDKLRKIFAELRLEVEKELGDSADKVLILLDNRLIPQSESVEAKVFYQKMKGDYYRYIAEISTDKQREEVADKSDEAYQSATLIASKLQPTHPIRLGLALNYSVFYYEIKNQPEKACKLAKEAFDNAIAEIDSLSEDIYKDSTLIMQLLRDNLTLWESGADTDAEGEQAGEAEKQD